MKEFLYNRIEALKEYIQITLKLTSFPNIPVTISKDNETITLVPDATGQVKTTLPSIGEWHLTTTYQDHIINKTLNCLTLGLIYKVDMTKFCVLTIEGDPNNEIEITNGIFTYKSEVNEDGFCIMEIGVGDWEITSRNQNFSISDTITVTFDDVELAKVLKMPRVNVITDVGNIITISNDENQLSGFADENGEFSTLIGLGSYEITMSNGTINQSQSIIIDEINRDYEVRMAFPTITVTTNPGNTITLTNSVQTVSGAADINGIYVAQVGFGTWSAISSTGELSLAATESVIVNEYSKNYEITVFLSTITVTTDPGNIVTITSNKISNGGTADENGICVLQALVGEWEIKTTLPSNENIYVIDSVEVLENSQNYSIFIKLPTITVHTNIKRGATIQATQGGLLVQGTTDNNGDCILQVPLGFFQVVAESGTTQSDSISVEQHSMNYELSFTFIEIYGAQWAGGSSSAWTRTDMAAGFGVCNPYVAGASSYGSPFDDIMPWSGMQIVQRTGGSMVSIPKFWYKLTSYGSGGLKIQISNMKLSGYRTSPAHMDRGDGYGERDVVYIGRYHSAGDYKSKSGYGAIRSIKREVARSGIHNLGSKIWQVDFAMRFTIWLLYLVEFANWDSQSTIGMGAAAYSGTGSTSTNKVGQTDSMLQYYHTGTIASSRDSKGETQYRNIEGLWSGQSDFVDGCYNTSSSKGYFWVILNPNNFSDTTGGVSLGGVNSESPSSFGVSNENGGFLCFIPTAGGGSGFADRWAWSSSNKQVISGYSQPTSYAGLFYIGHLSTANTSTGCRIMELP